MRRAAPRPMMRWLRPFRARPGPHFLVAGSYGHGNAGDEAILRAIVSGLRRRSPAAAIDVVAGDESAVRRLGVETVSWIDWPAIAAAVRRADLVLVGGGGLFFDTSGLREDRLLTSEARDLTHFLGVPLLAAAFRRPWMVFACGAGPLRTPRGRDVVRSILLSAAALDVRDEGSADELEGLGISRDRIRVTADPAFCGALASDAAARLEERLRGHGIPPGARCAAAAPRELRAGEAWEKAFARALRGHCERTGAAALLIPFQRGWDEPAVRRVAAELGGVPHVVLEGADDLEAAAAVARSSLTLAMRLHSLVFALRAGVPAASLAYEAKVRYLAERSGFGRYCVPMERAELLDERVREIEARRDLAALARRSGRALARASEASFVRAARLLAAPPAPIPPDGTLAALLAGVAERIRGLEGGAAG